MQQYLVHIVFRIENQAEHIAQFDEQVRLIKAGSIVEAYEKAIYLGLSEEGTVNNVNGISLKWTFVGMTRLLEMGELSDQSELFSSTRETTLPQQYIQFVKEKQQALLLSINAYNNGKISICI